MSVFLLKVTEQIHLSPLVSFSSTDFYNLETGLSYISRVCSRRANFAPTAGTGMGPKQDSDSNPRQGLGCRDPFVHPHFFCRCPPANSHAFLSCRTCGQRILHMLF